MNEPIQVDRQQVRWDPDWHLLSVLIIEDEKLVAWDMQQILNDAGFKKVVLTSTLSGAHAQLENPVHAFGLAVLDLKLEDGDGTSLIAHFLAKNIAVLVVTGYGSFNHPGVGVLRKPFSAQDLAVAAQSLLAGRRS